jgi:RHS repeat-associated protein
MLPLNPYRYTGKRWDSGSGTLDMGARRFGPSTARFLQQDRYQGTLTDLGLALDPLTQNRYALSDANPINFVEVDGHFGQMVVGALIGGGIDLGMQLAQDGGNFRDGNWTPVSISVR